MSATPHHSPAVRWQADGVELLAAAGRSAFRVAVDHSLRRA